MILKILRWIKGYVVFEIIGRFPERFINLSVRQGKFVFSTKPYPDKFLASLMLSDYRSIRHIARKSSVRLRVKERHGLPFMIDRYRTRSGLLAGFILFVVVAFTMQSFVWSIEINGVATISESYLLETIREEGLGRGSYKRGIDLSLLQRNVMKKVDEIGWMSVNIIGTKAEVEIKEKEIKPHILEADVPCNIKAGIDGVILSMNTKYGTSVISPGSAVIKGSLLVSGVNENPSGKVSFVHADAQVIAQTQRAVRFTLPKSGSIMLPDKSIKRYRADFLWGDIPLTFESVKGDYSSRIERKNIFLNETQMPLGLVIEHCTTYKTADFFHESENAREILNADDMLYRLFALSECMTISADMNIYENESDFASNIIYECTEDIAVEEKFIVN